MGDVFALRYQKEAKPLSLRCWCFIMGRVSDISTTFADKASSYILFK